MRSHVSLFWTKKLYVAYAVSSGSILCPVSHYRCVLCPIISVFCVPSLVSCVLCPIMSVSHVPCPVSHVPCPMSHVLCPVPTCTEAWGGAPPSPPLAVQVPVRVRPHLLGGRYLLGYWKDVIFFLHNAQIGWHVKLYWWGVLSKGF